MKIAVVSFYYYAHNYWCNHDILEEYCDMHGYDLHYNIKKVKDTSIHEPTYDGMVYMRQLLEKGYDRVFWFDGSDIIITNFSMKLENMVGSKPIQFSNDVLPSYPIDSWGCNSGFWSVDSSDISKQFLDDVLETYDPEYHHGWNETYWGDQDILNTISVNYKDYLDTECLHQSYWFYNSTEFYSMGIVEQIEYFSNQGKNINTYKLGDFLIHFAGGVVNTRTMTEVYERLRKVIEEK